MLNERLHYRIEKYLLGQLPGEEKVRLEAEIAENPEIREQVEVQRLALIGLKEYAAADMREKFKQWDRELDAAPHALLSPTSFPSRVKVLAGISAVLFLLLSSIVIWHFQQMKSVRKLEEQRKQEIDRRDAMIIDLQAAIQKKQAELESALGADSLSREGIKLLQEDLDLMELKIKQLQEHLPLRNQQIAMILAPLPDSIVIRSRGIEEELDPQLAAAWLAYDSSYYNKAANLLQSISPSDTLLHRGALQLLPFALFYSQRYEEAVPAFAELKATDKYLAKKAEGYILLCYIALGRELEARKMLPGILKDPGHPFYKQAKMIESAFH